MTDEQKAQMNTIWSELMWLVSEGYVVEYADSTLQANPYLPRPKDKSEKVEEPENLGIADEPIVAPKAEENVEETTEEVAEESAEQVEQTGEKAE
ncbi:MAG: hypothetical protein IJF70_05420 [Opitutales bacterium]|nr:hypothetical protein [Opitutales bacterium]